MKDRKMTSDGKKQMRVIVAAGGTGGHVFPGIAVAEEVRNRGGGIVFLGTKEGIEAREVPRAGFELSTLQVAKLKRVSFLTRVKALYFAPGALWAAIKTMRNFRPHAVVGAGGYVSGPAVLAAKLLGIPSIILEQNSIPGVTNRALSRLVNHSIVAFEEALHRLPRSLNLGNPIRAEIVERLTRASRHEKKEGFVLLVIGGSQGARALNDVMAKVAPALGKMDIKVLHGAGNADAAWVEKSYARWGVDAEVLPFINDMASAYEACDLVFCRAGATTIAELTLVGKPAILVPFPFAADDHQTANAESLSQRGAALCLSQKELTTKRFLQELRRLVSDSSTRAEMGEAMKGLERPDAAARVVDLLEEISKGAGV